MPSSKKQKQKQRQAKTLSPLHGFVLFSLLFSFSFILFFFFGFSQINSLLGRGGGEDVLRVAFINIARWGVAAAAAAKRC